MKLLLKILIITLFLQFGGCTIFQEIAGNGPSAFKAPKEVKNKIINPVLPNARLSVLWIGHASCLIQMDDKQILTDPVLTTTIGIFSKRLIEPGIETENIPKLDLMSLSHPHIDHLSLGTLNELKDKNRNLPVVFPEGVESYLPGYDYNYIRMQNHRGYIDNNPVGDSVTVNGITIYTVYARHWGGRYGLDGFLWGEHSYTGFIFQYNGLTVYFGGDTGYDPLSFKKLSERFNIDLAMIPIGPCDECNGCGNKRHVYPEGAIKIFIDLKAKVLMPIHYGVFQFRLADVNDPLYKLEKLLKEYNIEDKTQSLKIGEQRIFINK
ncbi:MAG: MBL fold metallo-hydrolase [Ignavibacteria bacterium]|nr:MBL fold metallo-hydrolase [Ignavibacteriota bacterium]